MLLLLLVAGCNALPSFTESRPTATSPARTPTPSPVQPVTASPTQVETPAGPTTVTVWLPPQFDPANGSLSGKLLQERLDEFSARRPGIRLDVRIKSLEGNGGMLDALSAANAAAPRALPDLILLPRSLLEAAALKGLLHPLDGLTSSLDDTDWYEYARELASLQNSAFGIPFAGDALLLSYRPSFIPAPPRDFSSVLQTQETLSFPAADPLSLLTLSLYQAAGGSVQDVLGRPTLDPDKLAQVLAFYQEAAAAGVISDRTTQLEKDEQAWSDYLGGQSNIAVTWLTRFLSQGNDFQAQNSAAPLFSPDGKPYTLATGWAWALASPQPEKQSLSVELAEYLTKSDFLSEWTSAAGYLPPRSTALSAWKNTDMQTLANQVALSSHLYPTTDLLSSLAPALRHATLQAIKGQGDPQTLAQQAVNRLLNP